MRILRSLLMGLVLVVVSAISNSAYADMGRSPAGPGSTYASLFGGYVNADGLETNGHILSPAGGAPAITVEVDDAYFVGGTLGYVFGTSVFGLENTRIEGSFSATNFFEADRSDVDGTFLIHQGFAQTGLGGPIETTQNRHAYDTALALKGDLGSESGIAAAIGLEFFVRYSEDEQEIVRIIGPADTRDADVDTWFYGAMFVVQPEIPVNGGVSVVFDLGAGVYGYDSDGDFDSTVGGGGAVPTISDSDSGVGFRGRAIGGLKFSFEFFSATLFGGVDYWSNVPVAEFAAANIAPLTTQLNKEDLWEIKAGIDITVPFGG